MAERVEEEIAGNFRIADGGLFYSTLLPVDDNLVNNVTAAFQNDNGLKQLQAFPKLGLEENLYALFVDVANKILKYPGIQHSHSHWISRANNYPESLDEDSAVLRPDGACVLGDKTAYFAALDVLESLTPRNQAVEPSLLQQAETLGKIVALHADDQINYYQHTPTADETKTDLITEVKELHSYILSLQHLHDPGPIEEAGEQLEIVLKTKLKDVLQQGKLILENIGECVNQVSAGGDSMQQLQSCTREAIRYLYQSLPVIKHCEVSLEGLRPIRVRTALSRMRDLEKIATLWWLRIVVPIEMKPKFNPKSVQVGSSRLLRYMRLVLRNQLDRRFVFGILICSHFMRVFFCDRSGLLTTSEWIDLHDPKDTKTFVHVILAFSSLDVFKLGWDETMKLHLQSTSTPSNLKFEYSTDPSVRLQDYGKSSYETQWSIFVPDQMGSKTGKDYVTVRALSLKQAEVMAGRATVVWMVKELNEGSPRTVKQDPTGVIKVLKSAWNRSHPPSPTEKELLGDTVLEHVVNIECSVPVGMSTLQTGDDLPAIRGRIQGKNGVWENGVQLGTIMKTAKRKARTTESEDVSDVTSHRTLAQQPNRVSSTLVSRVLTRTVMRTYGWPIKFFKDRVELVTILRDTVIGHRELYFKRKVAHRDVSTGNVMACPIRGDVAKTQGVLIDLDHAKMAKERISLVDFHNVPRPLHKFWVSIQNTYDSFRDEDLGRRLWHYSRGDATKAGQIVKLCAYHCNALGAKYVDESKWDNIENELRSLLPSSTLISQGYFLDEKNCPPSWVKSELRSNIGARIGTLPFMSYEVLFSPQQYPVKFSNLRTDVVNLQPVHGAIHDLESLFWIFLYLCLTRAGPGGKRRADFDEEPTGECDAVAKLHAIVWRLFESPEDHEIAFNKRDLFIHPESLKTLLIPAMHPYFEPLHQLLIDWWGLLRSSYQTYNDIEQGLIHLKVIELLGATLRDLKNSQVDELELENNEEVKAMTEAELERRRVDLERYRLYPHPYDPSLAPQPPLEPVSHVASPKATAGKRVAGSENQVVSHSSPESQTSHRPRKKAHMASYHDGE